MNEVEWESTDRVGRMFEVLERQRSSADAVRLLVLRLARGDNKVEPLTSDGTFEPEGYNGMIATFRPPARQHPAGWYGSMLEHVYFALDGDEPHRRRSQHADLIREQIGNPFRPSAVRPAWLTSDVIALATGIREEAAFDRMPILADALQDAGCDDDRILDHCRQTDKPHHAGCWLLTAVGRTQWNLAHSSGRAMLLALADRLRQRMVRAAVIYLAERLTLDQDFLNVVTGGTGYRPVQDFKTPEFVSVCDLLREASEAGEPMDSYLALMRDWHSLGFNECRLVREFMPNPPA